MPIRRKLRAFASRTSMHGVPRIIDAKTLPARFMWSAVFLLAISLFTWQMSAIVLRYLSFPKKVKLEVVNAPIPFPAVTVCSNYHIDAVIAHLIEDIRNSTKNVNNLTIDSNTQGAALVKEYFNYLRNIKAIDRIYDESKEYRKHRRHRIAGYLSRLMSRSGLLSNIGQESARQLGVKLNDFVVSCTFAGVLCNTSDDFTRYLHNYYFNCFTFNPNVSVEDRGRLLTGVDYGLSITMYTGAGGIIRGLHGMERVSPIGATSAISSGRGVRAVVHPQGTEPHPIADGFDIIPGHSVSVGVKAIETERLPLPYGNCTDAESIDIYKYSIVTCQLGCIQREIIKTCACADSDLVTISSEDGEPVSFCSRLPEISDDCRGKDIDIDFCRSQLDPWYNRLACRQNVNVHMTFMNSTSMANCHCFSPCYDTNYYLSYSISKLPFESISFRGIVKGYLRGLNPKKRSVFSERIRAENWYNFMPHFTRLNVHIADTNIARTIEVPDYDRNALMSDIGGQLGLWVGISVITLIEITELFVGLFKYFLCEDKPVKRRNRAEDQDRRQNGLQIEDIWQATD